MGQTLGKAQVKPAARPFVNLPQSLVESVSDCVHEVAEGFGLSAGEVKQIVQVSLHEYFSRLSESDLDECAEALFALFATGGQSNSDGALVDSFELMATICIASGMQLHEKLDFLFTLFDINEAGNLTINEATLAFRTLAAGTAKIADASVSIDVEAIDRVALEAFELSVPDRYLMDSQSLEVEEHSLTKQQFADFVFNCAETLSLLTHFDDLDVASAKPNPSLETESAKLAPLRFRVTAAEQSSTEEEPWKERFLRNDNDEETSPPPPTDALKLGWVYGRNAHTPSLYCNNGDVLFAAGSMVVKVSVANDGSATQEYFLGHSGHVTSIDVFHLNGSVGDIVASADVGDSATICVWSANSLNSIAAIPSFHESGTAKICFSPSGKLLLSLGNDATPSVAVYNWREKRVLFTSKVPGTEVYDCSFLGSDNSLGVCSDDAVHFWTRSEPNVPYVRHRGVFNRLSTEEPMTRIACGGGTVVTGSLFGRLWMWEGRVCTKLVNALRSGPVTGLHAPRDSRSTALCVSTHGGLVLLLDADLNIQHRLAPNKGLDDSDRVVDSICWHPELERVLVGQGGNSLFEMPLSSEGDATMITAGHYGVAGMATLSQSIVTVGKDAIKVWGATQHRVLRETSLEATLSCVAYNPQQDQIAVGFAAADGARSSVDHSFAILNGGDLQVIHRGGNSVKTLTVCAYSSDGKLLAFGSADAAIYIHKCTETDFPLLAKLRGHTSPICSLDFGCEKSSDAAAFLRSNSVGREAMFWTTRGKTQTPLSQRDTVWETQTCVYSASLEGAHNACDEQVHITSCSTFSSHGDGTVVVGDSSGRVRVFSHPVPTSQPLSLDYRGHSGRIQSIQVSPDRHVVYTLSLNDSCLFQWTHTSGTHWERGLPTAPLRSKPLANSNGKPALDMQTMIDQMDSLDFRKSKEKRALLTDHKPRPWTRSIVAPTNFRPSAGALPDRHFVLERIHGYNGKAKNGLQCLGDDTIVFSVGKTLVRYNVNEDKQAFCTAATGAITSLAVHQGGSLCAIGQEEASPAIIIVDLKTMKPRAFLTGGAGGVVCLDIDDTAKLVVSLSSSQQIVVHDWKSGAVIASSKTYGLETLDVSFLRGSSNQFVECGVCFVRFWTLKGGSLSFEEVALNSLENHTQFYSSLGWNGDSLVVGTSSGDIIQFDGQQPGNRRVKAHQTAVANISSAKDGFVSSSLDCVKVWSRDMQCTLSVSSEAIGTTHQISSLSWANDKIFVGTGGSDIYELSSEDGSNLNREGRTLIGSHSSSPVGLSVHPNGTFATSGDDAVLRIWNPHDFQEHIPIELAASSRAFAFSPDANGRMIAVGLGKPSAKGVVDGKWIILHLSADGNTSQIVAERRDVRKHITEIKWHSSGERLAVGSFDKKICVYKLATETKPAVSVEVTLLSTIDLTSAPSHFDFSRDGKYLRVSSESNELHFLEASPGLYIKEPSRLKDTEWETQTSIFGWNVQGVWQMGAPNVASVDCSVQDCPTIVSGDAEGTLRIHQHPCTSSSAQFASYSAHLGPVGKVRWILGGYAVSTGEQDNAVMVWRQEVDEGLADRLDVAAPKAHFDASKALSNEEAGCNSAVYDLTGQVVYPSSGNCVVFDKTQNCNEPQQSFQHHESTVTAICSSHSRQLLASGDANAVRVWDSQTCTEVAKLSEDCQQHVSVLSFSSDDAKLVSVGSNGPSPTICVWTTLTGDWKDAHLAFHTLAGHEMIHFCLFDANQSLVSGGSRHVNFWSEQNSTLVVSKGVLSQQCISDSFTCGAAMDDKLVTGTASGSLVVWEAKKIVQELPQAHNGQILSLCACPEGVVAGCEEGVVVLWSRNLQKTASFDTTTSSPSPTQPICSIDITAHTSRRSTARILVRTRSGDILEISCVTGDVISLVSGDLRLTEGPSAAQLGSID